MKSRSKKVTKRDRDQYEKGLMKLGWSRSQAHATAQAMYQGRNGPAKDTADITPAVTKARRQRRSGRR